MAGHAKKSPSKWQQLDLCSGSGTAQEGEPDRYRPSAVKGTAVHRVLEHVIDTGKTKVFDKDAFKVGVDISGLENAPGYAADGKFWVTLNREDLAGAKAAYDYVLSKRKPGTEVYSEMKVDPGFYLEREDCSGTLDVAIIDSNQHAEIIDYKNGSGVVVEVDKNLQMIAYMLGFLAMMVAEGFKLKTITATIIQPNAYHPAGPIRSVTYTVKELLTWVPYVKKFLTKSDDPKALRAAGEKQCQFCKVKGKCKVLAEHSLKQAQATFKALGDTTLNDIDAALEVDSKSITPEQRAMVIASTSLIRGWLEAVNAFAVTEDVKGRKTPGFKVIRGSGSKRKYKKDEDGMWDELQELSKTDGSAVYWDEVSATKLLSSKQLEVKLKPLVTKETWKEIEKWIVKPEGGLTMVSDSDPRQPVRQEAKAAFSSLLPKLDFLS